MKTVSYVTRPCQVQTSVVKKSAPAMLPQCAFRNVCHEVGRCGTGYALPVPTAADALTVAPRADVIVTNILLPGHLDGIELVRRLKNEKDKTRIPVIVLTACVWRSDDRLDTHRATHERECGASENGVGIMWILKRMTARTLKSGAGCLPLQPNRRLPRRCSSHGRRSAPVIAPRESDSCTAHGWLDLRLGALVVLERCAH